jgi:hypothetical protein
MRACSCALLAPLAIYKLWPKSLHGCAKPDSKTTSSQEFRERERQT